jgi:hypothetical protein
MTIIKKENIMQNKRLYIIIGVVIIIVAAAAFVGGRLLNGRAGPLGMFAMGNGDTFAVSIHMTRAPELPTSEPALTGVFVQRDDNTLTLQSMSDAGPFLSTGGGGAVAVSPADRSDGPKVEVVITTQTKIWRDTTPFSGPPPSGGEMTVQQQVSAGSLDDLNSQTVVMVWGRKNGDRIIADVISYSNPMIFKRP